MSPDTPASDGFTAKQGIKSVDTMFSIVESMLEVESAGITELANESDLSKGAIYKHLATLRQNGYVVKNGDRYSLSLRFLDVGSRIRDQNGFDKVVQSKVNQLADSTGQSAAFVAEEGGRAVVLYRCPGQNRMTSRTRVGTPMMMHRTAAGKAILSTFPTERVNEIVDRHGLERSSDATIVDEDELHEALEETRTRGYAVNFGESTPGLSAIAVPVTDGADTTLGAFSVSGSEHLFKDGEFREDVYDKLGSIRNEVEFQHVFS